MASTGLLVVSNIKQFGSTLCAIEKYVGALYVHLNIPAAERIHPVPTWGRLISQLYVDSKSYCNTNLDMRILIGPLKKCSLSGLNLKKVDMIFSDSHFPEICEQLREHLNISSKTIYLHDEPINDIIDYEVFDKAHNVYDTVVLGGTFDRIHIGHKILLTEAVLRACKKLVVGVSSGVLTKSKTLAELILPVEQRIRDVEEFLVEIDSTLQYDVVPIYDPFGPTQSDPNMDLIVVSAETLRGGEKINEIRAKNNLRPLEVFCIDVVESNAGKGPKETKISSSNTRLDMLGTRIRDPEPRPHLPSEPYIIGLTGGIASGKTKMAQRFRDMGAFVLDCDKIAHEIYEPGEVCYEKIVRHFGSDILGTDKRINRAKLGAIVFNDSKKLDTLNQIVWPELLLEVKRRIRNLHAENQHKLVVIEAAVLLNASWETECHEVWSMIVPPEVAVQRVMERNKISKEEALKRIASQLPNSEIVAKSNVVFSSQWDSEFTQQQATKAWQILTQDIKTKHGLNML